MFAHDPDTHLPTERELAVAEEVRLFATIQRAWLFPRIGATFNAHATEKLVHVWNTLIAGIEQSTRRITGARLSLPTRHIDALLKDNADPQAIRVLPLIRVLPVIGASVQTGPVGALELITRLVDAGYRVSGEEVDAITVAFGHSINQALSGAEWLAAGCPSVVLHNVDSEQHTVTPAVAAGATEASRSC